MSPARPAMTARVARTGVTWALNLGMPANELKTGDLTTHDPTTGRPPTAAGPEGVPGGRRAMETAPSRAGRSGSGTCMWSQTCPSAVVQATDRTMTTRAATDTPVRQATGRMVAHGRRPTAASLRPCLARRASRFPAVPASGPASRTMAAAISRFPATTAEIPATPSRMALCRRHETMRQECPVLLLSCQPPLTTRDRGAKGTPFPSRSMRPSSRRSPGTYGTRITSEPAPCR